MIATLIYIDNQLVDIDEKTLVATSYQLGEVGDLRTRYSNYSNRIKLPKTERNTMIFGYAENVNSETDVPYKKLSAKVLQNGLEIMPNATAIIRSADDFYSVELYSGSFDFFGRMGQKRLDDMFQGALPQLIDWPLSNSLLSDAFINDGGLNEGANPLAYRTRLGIKYKDLLDNIISTNGYTKSGNIFNDATLNALYLHCLNFNSKYSTKFCTPKEFEAHRDPAVVFNATDTNNKMNFTDVKFNGGLYNGTNTFEVNDPLLGGAYFYFNMYAVLVITNIAFAGGATRLRVQLFSGSATYTINNITAPGTYFLELSDNVGNDPLGSPVTKVVGQDGQNSYIQIRCTDNVGTPTGTATVTFGAGTKLYNKCLATNPLPAIYQSTGGLMPDLLQKDFFKDFAIRTGTLFREQGSTLVCKTLEEIINDRANAKNWTHKRDITQPDGVVYFFRNYAQSNYFRYNNADDFVDEFTGQGNLNIANFNLDEDRLYYTSPFNSSFTRRHGNVNAGFVTAAYVPIVESGQDKTDPGLRLLMVRAKRSYEPTLSGPTSSYNVAYFEDVDGLEGKDASFEHALTRHYPSFKKYLQKAKMLTRMYWLNEEDIAGLDLFNLIYDDGVYYLVNAIKNYVGPDAATKTEIFKVS